MAAAGRRLALAAYYMAWRWGRSPTEDEVIDDEIRRGTSVNDLTNKIFWNRHPEFRDCRLPRSCQELEQLQREWALIQGKVAAKKTRADARTCRSLGRAHR